MSSDDSLGRISRLRGKREGEEERLLLGDSLSPEAKEISNYSSSISNKNKAVVFSKPNYEVDKGDKVPIWKKLAYAVGSIPYAMCVTVVGFYFSIFLLEVVILDPTYVLIIVFIGRVWDAVTDPVVGFLTSLTKTRFGRLRPWLALSAVPTAVCYFFLWYVPPFLYDSRTGDVYKFVYYLIAYLLFQASLTCIHVPYTALTMHMTNDPKERDSVTLYRMCCEVIGTLIGIVVYTIYYVGFVGSQSNQDCNGGERIQNPDKIAAYRWHALTLSVVIVTCISVTVIFIREQKAEAKTDKKIGFFRGIKETWGFKPYFYLLMVELFTWLALQFIQGNMALFIKYSIGLEDQYPYVIAVLLISSMLFMPLWQFCIVKFGKKTTFYIGMWTILPVLLLLLYVDKVPLASYPLYFMGGLGVGCAYLLPWSMLPDVIDEAALKREVRREELFYAFFVFGNKFGSGVTLGISTAIYKLVGYDGTVCEQPWTVPLTLKLLVVVPPIIFILIALSFLHFYPITSKTIPRTKCLLDEKRKRLSRPTSVGVDGNNGTVAVSTNKSRSRGRAAPDDVPSRIKLSDSQQTGF